MAAIMDKTRESRTNSADGNRVRVIKVYLLDGKTGERSRSWLSVVHFLELKGLSLFVGDDRGYRRIAPAFAMSLLSKPDQQSLLAILKRSGNGGVFAPSEQNHIQREQVEQLTDQSQVDEAELEDEMRTGNAAAESGNRLESDEIFSAGNIKGIAWTLFKDYGNVLATNSNGAGVAESLVRIAHARGWSSIRVHGTETFRHAVWVEAATRGIRVKGYIPSGLMNIDASKLTAPPGKALHHDFPTGEITQKRHARVYREKMLDPQASEYVFTAYEQSVVMARIYENLSQGVERDEPFLFRINTAALPEDQVMVQLGVG